MERNGFRYSMEFDRPFVSLGWCSLGRCLSFLKIDRMSQLDDTGVGRMSLLGEFEKCVECWEFWALEFGMLVTSFPRGMLPSG